MLEHELRRRWTKEASFRGILREFTGTTAADFFQTGETEVRDLLARAVDLGLASRGTALDFGCGMGRLSRALADRFDHVIGLDISPRMVERAGEYDHRPDYRLMGLEMPEVEPVDFLVSVYVLQHLPLAVAAGYLARFPSLLISGGLGAVQVSTPSEEGGIGDVDARSTLGDCLLAVDERGGWADANVVSRTYWFSASA